MPQLQRTASVCALLVSLGCTAPPAPASSCAPTEPERPKQDTPPQLDIMPLALTDPPREGPPPEPAPPTFEAAPEPDYAKTLIREGRRNSCSITAEQNPDVLVVYSMIDVYSLISTGLALRNPLDVLAQKPPCKFEYCEPAKPNPVLIHDDGNSPLDGTAYGFVIPLASGFWVLPLGMDYREDRCMPDIDAEVIADGHARLTIMRQEADELDCDEVEGGELCGTACFYSDAIQYDLFFDAGKNQTLLVTRWYQKLDDDDEPTPAITVELDGDAVHIAGCRVDRRIAWPPHSAGSANTPA